MCCCCHSCYKVKVYHKMCIYDQRIIFCIMYVISWRETAAVFHALCGESMPLTVSPSECLSLSLNSFRIRDGRKKIFNWRVHIWQTPWLTGSNETQYEGQRNELQIQWLYWTILWGVRQGAEQSMRTRKDGSIVKLKNSKLVEQEREQRQCRVWKSGRY